MRSIYKYIVAVVVLFSVQYALAQEVITDQLIYDRVTGYMTTESDVERLPVYKGLNIQEIRWEHDITLWYGAPGLISELMLDKVFMEYVDEYVNFEQRLNSKRTSTGPMYQLSTVGLNYHKSLLPWLSLGVKATFAATWQSEFDVFTRERLYDNNCYNVAALVDARFSLLRRRNVEMYSSVGLGLCAHIQREFGGLWPMGDVAFVGLRVGRAFYGFLEIGAGVGGSVRGGFGVRFNGNK